MSPVSASNQVCGKLPTAKKTQPQQQNGVQAEDNHHRPPTTVESAAAIFAQLYSKISIKKMVEIESYEDRNYLITAVDGTRYVFKINNAADSAIAGLLEGQNQCMLHLEKYGDFRVSVPLANDHGTYVVRKIVAPDTDNQYAIRLLSFLAGPRLIDHALTPEMLRQCGNLLGRVQRCLNIGQDLHDHNNNNTNNIINNNQNHNNHNQMKNGGENLTKPTIPEFENAVIRKRKIDWCLESIGGLRAKYSVLNESQTELIERMIATFERELLQNGLYHRLTHAYIHGDFNEANLMVSPDRRNSDGLPLVDGIIDFGDLSYSPRLLDLAYCVAYMMLIGDLSAGAEAQIRTVPAYVISAFTRRIPLSEQEISLIPLCAAARIAQSITCGLWNYATQTDPNPYLLNTQTNGWKVLRALLAADTARLVADWRSIADIAVN